MIWAYIVVYIPILGIAVASWLLSRNRAVFLFQKELLNMTSDAATRILYDENMSFDERSKEWHKPYNIMERYSYSQMLYSLRPLKLEAWFTEEEIKILTGR